MKVKHLYTEAFFTGNHRGGVLTGGEVTLINVELVKGDKMSYRVIINVSLKGQYRWPVKK